MSKAASHKSNNQLEFILLRLGSDESFNLFVHDLPMPIELHNSVEAIRGKNEADSSLKEYKGHILNAYNNLMNKMSDALAFELKVANAKLKREKRKARLEEYVFPTFKKIKSNLQKLCARNNVSESDLNLFLEWYNKMLKYPFDNLMVAIIWSTKIIETISTDRAHLPNETVPIAAEKSAEAISKLMQASRELEMDMPFKTRGQIKAFYLLLLNTEINQSILEFESNLPRVVLSKKTNQDKSDSTRNIFNFPKGYISGVSELVAGCVAEKSKPAVSIFFQTQRISGPPIFLNNRSKFYSILHNLRKHSIIEHSTGEYVAELINKAFVLLKKDNTTTALGASNIQGAISRGIYRKRPFIDVEDFFKNLPENSSD